MPKECITQSLDFGTLEGRRVEAAFDGGLVTSDAGALLLSATDRAIRMMDRFASCFHDERRPRGDLDLAIMKVPALMDMDTWEKRHAVAERHVTDGRKAIDHQRSIIARQKALRVNTEASEALLAAFERSQEIFEGNLARLLQERVGATSRLG
jgi:hypothetical protein